MGFLREIAKDKTCTLFQRYYDKHGFELLNQTTRNGSLLWHLAFQYQNLALARSVYSLHHETKQKALLHTQTLTKRKTAMHFAAMSGDAHAIQWLDDIGAECAPLDAQKNSPLHLAAQRGFTDAVAVLLNINHFPLRLFNTDGYQPFHLAVLSGRFSTVKAFVDVVDRSFIFNLTHQFTPPAILAAHSGSGKAFQILATHTPHGLRDKSTGNTPIHIAAANGDLWFMWQALTVAPFTLDERNKDGKTAAELASNEICRRHLQLTKRFMQALHMGDYDALHDIIETCSYATRVQLFNQKYYMHSSLNALEFVLQSHYANIVDIITLLISKEAEVSPHYTLSQKQEKLINTARLRNHKHNYRILLNDAYLFNYMVELALTPGPYQGTDQHHLTDVFAFLYKSIAKKTSEPEPEPINAYFLQIRNFFFTYQHGTESALESAFITLQRMPASHIIFYLPYIDGQNIIAHCANQGDLNKLTAILFEFIPKIDFNVYGITEEGLAVLQIARARHSSHLYRFKNPACRCDNKPCTCKFSEQYTHYEQSIVTLLNSPKAIALFLDSVLAHQQRLFYGTSATIMDKYVDIDNDILFHLFLSLSVYFDASQNRIVPRPNDMWTLTEHDELMTKCCFCFLAKELGYHDMFKRLSEELSGLSGGLDGIFLECDTWQHMLSLSLIQLRMNSNIRKEAEERADKLSAELEAARAALERIHFGTVQVARVKVPATTTGSETYKPRLLRRKKSF